LELANYAKRIETFYEVIDDDLLESERLLKKIPSNKVKLNKSQQKKLNINYFLIYYLRFTFRCD
jgi:hypothetical protein